MAAIRRAMLAKTSTGLTESYQDWGSGLQLRWTTQKMFPSMGGIWFLLQIFNLETQDESTSFCEVKSPDVPGALAPKKNKRQG